MTNRVMVEVRVSVGVGGSVGVRVGLGSRSIYDQD